MNRGNTKTRRPKQRPPRGAEREAIHLARQLGLYLLVDRKAWIIYHATAGTELLTYWPDSLAVVTASDRVKVQDWREALQMAARLSARQAQYQGRVQP
jgi:hypothetical protein